MSDDNIKNWLIVIPALLLAGGASFYLWNDYQTQQLTEKKSEENLKSIGVISTSNENVKRKSTNSLYWNKVEPGEKVYSDDSIRTGSNSYVAVQLYNATEVELSENSLITLQEQSEGIHVKFKAGDMQTKAGNSNISIDVNNSTLKTQNSELKLKTSSDNKTEIIVQKGTATLKGTDNKTTELSKEKILKIDEKGRTESFELSVSLNTPKDKAIIFDDRNEIKYPFTWNTLNEKIEDQIFELSTDLQFAKTSKIYSKLSQRAINAPVQKGISYWRVSWKANNKIYHSETRMITVKEDKRIQLIQPQHQTVVQISPSEDSIGFSWKAEDNAKLFVLEVSKNKEFTELNNTMTTPKSNVDIKNIGEGSYWWRVQAFGANNEVIGRSQGYNFNVKRILPQLPILKSPANGSSWSLTDPILFEWQPMAEAKSYKILITSDSAQKLQLKSTIQPANSYLWKWDATGTFYWSVTAMNAKSQTIGQSVLYKNQISSNVLGPAITLVSPENQSSLIRERRDPIDPVVFIWRLEKPLSGTFTLLISESTDFSKAVKKDEISGTRYALRLSKSANYYWKVEWHDPKEPTKKEESSTFVLKFRMSSKIAPPLLVEPLNEAKKYVAEKDSLDFSWHQAPSAENYHIILERYNPNTKESVPVMDKIVKEIAIKSMPLEPGTYRWYVSSLDLENIEGPVSETRTFTVEVKKELTAPKLNVPIVK